MTPERLQTLARLHAPIVRLHSEDRVGPMSPTAFVGGCRLRMYDRRQAGHSALHPVLNIETRKWMKPPAVRALMGQEFFGPPLDLLGDLALHPDGSNRRPFDRKAAGRGNVFLEHRHRVPTGEGDPTGTVPSFYFWKSSGNGEGLLTFWFFYGYSRYQAAPMFGHQGDWEHISLLLDRGGQLNGGYFAAHGRPARVPADKLEVRKGRTIVYSARGSHASYARAGAHPHGDETDEGPEWETWRSLEPLSGQAWRRFAGAWGSVGTMAMTTGPLGPWYKRHRK